MLKDIFKMVLVFADEPDLEDALLSDGEDYHEDDILRDLRTKRLFLIHKLKSIDKILSEQEEN